jgi:hypothetical protein
MDVEEHPFRPLAVQTAWSEQVEALLEDWHHRVYAAQSAHYASADLFRRLNYIVGIPATIFASAVGTTLFANLAETQPKRWLVASTSILAAVLTGLQTFLRFSEQATHHATAADWYSAIRRDIEQLLHLPVSERSAPKKCLDDVRKEMNRAAQDSPPLSGSQWNREPERFGVAEPPRPRN